MEPAVPASRVARVALAATLVAGARARAQQPDTTHPVVLAPVTVSVTRSTAPRARAPLAVAAVDSAAISKGRPTWALGEALTTVPGVFVADRANFSLDERISIRGFGARSAFAVRGVKVLLDGIPQTLPDGQGQLTNLELSSADRVEVERGSASALFGNASGGVISIWTDRVPPAGALGGSARVVAGRFDRNGRTWTKWTASPEARVGDGDLLLTVSRLDYEGERQHSAADFRDANAHLALPLAPAWSLTSIVDWGDDPRADNPGALKLSELQVNRDTAPPANVTNQAGKAVTQLQVGGTVRHTFAQGGEADATVYAFSRDLKNPTTFAYIDLERFDYGARFTATAPPLPLGRFTQRVTAGFDFQRQRDDRKNYNNVGGQPDTANRQLDQLEHVTEVGPFVQDAVDVSPRATVTAGLRYDWVDFTVADRLITPTNPDDSGRRLMAAPSGSLGVAVAASDAVTVYANVGTSFETPTTTELANRPDSAGGFNPDLGPQHAVNYEVGARGALGSRVSFSAALFQADLTGELIPFEVATSPQRQFYRNAGTSRHRGIEVGATAELAAGLDLTAAWTYADYSYVHYTLVPDSTHSFVLDGRALPGIPRNWLHLTLRARPAAARGAWLEVEQTYSSDYYVSDTLATRTTPWWVTNVRLGWDGAVGRTRIAPFIGIDDAFNRLYVGSVVINAAAGRFYEPAPARNWYVGMSVSPR